MLSQSCCRFVTALSVFFVWAVHLRAQTTQTLKVNNVSASGDIADFQASNTNKVQIDLSGNISAAGNVSIPGLLLNGTGGGTITVLPPSTGFTSFNFNLPNGPGTSGQPLLSGGAGTPMNFAVLGPSGGGTGSSNGAVTTLCAGDTASLSSSNTTYFGFATSSGTETQTYAPVAVSGTVAAMHVTLSALPPYTVTFHARYNGNRFSPDLTCAISTLNTSCDATGGGAIVESATGSPKNWDIEAVTSSGTASPKVYTICLKVTGGN